MNLKPNVYQQGGDTPAFQGMDFVSFDLSCELRLQKYGWFGIERLQMAGKADRKLSVYRSRMETRNREKYIDRQAGSIASLTRGPTVSLIPYAWDDAIEQWVPFFKIDIAERPGQPKKVNLALFVPNGLEAVICLFAIGVFVQPGRAETAIFQLIASQVAAEWIELTKPDPLEILNENERACLVGAATGKSASEIAEMLSLSEYAVNQYFSIVCTKLKATNSAHAVAKAVTMGIVHPEEVL